VLAALLFYRRWIGQKNAGNAKKKMCRPKTPESILTACDLLQIGLQPTDCLALLAQQLLLLVDSKLVLQRANEKR
jgi:hypothetical protein